jgi:hypothetical protein
MEYLFSQIVPYDSEQLTKRRLGQSNDGGYIIPMEVLKEIEAVVVFGVNNEDSFEQDLAAFLDPRTIPFYLCDPFSAYTKKNAFTFLKRGLAAKTSESPENILPSQIGSLVVKSKHSMVTWPDFQTDYSLTGKRIFLKIDIEGAEWDSFKILKDSDLDNVVCLVIEFHGLTNLYDIGRKGEVLSKIHRLFTLVHCHQNNCGTYAPHAWHLFPDVLECTYVRNTFLEAEKISVTKRKTQYPSELDQPNSTERSDFPIYWWVDDPAAVFHPLTKE